MVGDLRGYESLMKFSSISNTWSAIAVSVCLYEGEIRARILARCILDKLVVSLDYKWSISLSEI